MLLNCLNSNVGDRKLESQNWLRHVVAEAVVQIKLDLIDFTVRYFVFMRNCSYVPIKILWKHPNR